MVFFVSVSIWLGAVVIEVEFSFIWIGLIFQAGEGYALF